MEDEQCVPSFRHLERVVRDHGRRIARLHTYMLGSLALSLILSAPAPSLCSLTLCMSEGCDDEGDTDKDVPLLFAGEAPLLRKLAISWCRHAYSYPSPISRTSPSNMSLRSGSEATIFSTCSNAVLVWSTS